MNKWLTIICCCCTAVVTYAQQELRDTILQRDFQFVKHSDPWLTERNAAALTRYQAPSMAEGELYLQHTKGRLCDYYQSPDLLQAGGLVEAFYRITPRTTVYGKVSYDNFSGRHMTGSAFIDPTRKPFDITALTRQWYHGINHGVALTPAVASRKFLLVSFMLTVSLPSKTQLCYRCGSHLDAGVATARISATTASRMLRREPTCWRALSRNCRDCVRNVL